MTGELSTVVEFGPFRLDRSARVLSREGEEIPLPPKAMDLLLVLVEAPGTLLTKADLMERVWPDTFVEEGNLPVTVFALRKALGDEGSAYVRTVPRHGYSFVASVTTRDDAGGPSSEPEPVRTQPVADAAREIRVARQTVAWKYIAAAVAAAALLLLSVPFIRTQSAVRADTPVQSVAVLPFTFNGADASDELLGAGLAGDISARLATLPQLVVRPLASTLKYDGSQSAALSEALHVDAVLTGSLRPDGNALRLSAELVRVSDGARLWTLSASREERTLLDTAGRVANAVAAIAVPGLDDSLRVHVSKRLSDSEEAYRLYLAGLAVGSQMTPRAVAEATSRLEQAVEIDPSFAVAHAQLAALSLLPLSGAATTARVTSAREAAQRALRLDASLGLAHGVIGVATLLSSWDWVSAGDEFSRGLALTPHDSELRLWHAIYLSALSRHDDALREVDEALALDPTSPRSHYYRGMMLLMARRYDEAIAQFRLTPLELGIVQQVYYGVGIANAKKTRYDLGHASLDRVGTRIDNAQLKAHQAFVLAESGDRPAAAAMLQSARTIDDGLRTPYTMFAAAEACIGEMDAAFAHLAQARDTGETRIVFANVDPILDCARSDPRFSSFLKSMRLGERPPGP